MIYYLDTSALIKIYHREGGTDFMRSLYRGNDERRFSELERLEFLSVMSRKCRAGEISNEFRRKSSTTGRAGGMKEGPLKGADRFPIDIYDILF